MTLFLCRWLLASSAWYVMRLKERPEWLHSDGLSGDSQESWWERHGQAEGGGVLDQYLVV